VIAYLLNNYPAIVDAIEVYCNQRRGIEEVYLTLSRELGGGERTSVESTDRIS
jgi:hypothetical protein